MFKALLIDDEQHCIDRLSQLLENQNEIISEYQSCCSVAEAETILENKTVDVIFLDVQLQNETGFDLLKNLASKITFEIIFTTAHDNYAVKAFEYSALDYLLKPIANTDLERALNKLKTKQSLLDSAQKVETLLYNLNEENTNKIINLTNAEGVHRIKVNDIVRCNADDNYTHIYFNPDKKITIAKTLKHFENLLQPYSFFRTHQSHLINLNYIKKFIPKKRIAVLTDNTEIVVSVRKKEELIAKLKNR
ncbi:LytTR family DNA-binding domain-containing protein [Aureibaculum sp. 2210JD6-5]|uniref:LytR/AlgR family response regulator transcription factor n=1 Tax=Aureibaculum sp. 2210JD6-5 TaxID=3103957 RepID=UPI002AADDE62|nr:LytTR family DNA-binding domain-containing protein [Aureibaculum sp. 2210JD6-5]MDY7395665.1 LytTR family DNA-binding domain-containing protein [Aureibaculum sp. 2210JD6-5]